MLFAVYPCLRTILSALSTGRLKPQPADRLGLYSKISTHFPALPRGLQICAVSSAAYGAGSFPRGCCSSPSPFRSSVHPDDATEPPDTAPPNLAAVGAEPPGLAQALAAQGRHTDRLLRSEGVVGTAIGLAPNGRVAVQIFTNTAEVLRGLPISLDGVPVSPVVTGRVSARSPPPPPLRPPRPSASTPSRGFPGRCRSGSPPETRASAPPEPSALGASPAPRSMR